MVLSKGLMNGKILTVNQITGAGTLAGDKRVIFFKEVYGQGEFVEDLEGIPLTEEILIKAGFINTSSGYYSNGKIEIGYTTTDDWLEYEYISITGQTEMTALKYVHQLQNLYYALTNEELVINL